MTESRRHTVKRRMSRALERTLVNRMNRALLRSGRLGSTYAVLETVGRRSGRPRQIPVANGLADDTFWLTSAHGRHAHYVHNLLANPRVRIGLVRDGELHWRTGTAHVLDADDTLARQRELGRGRLGYRLDAVLLRATATDLTTIRIDLDA
ncbi:MAG: nitroreductase/quinone reductase family protein [Solirubrobacteraceae bacterium]